MPLLEIYLPLIFDKLFGYQSLTMPIFELGKIKVFSFFYIHISRKLRIIMLNY